MVSIAARVRSVVAGVLATTAVAACVNDLVIDDRPAVGSGSAEGGCGETGCASDGAASHGSGDGSGGADGSGGGDGSGGSTTVPDPTSDTGGDGGGTTTTGASMGADPCSPCDGDEVCGGDYDNCVELVAGDPRCFAVCKEQPNPCAEGFSCMATVSVDGAMVNQCVPDAGQCS